MLRGVCLNLSPKISVGYRDGGEIPSKTGREYHHLQEALLTIFAGLST